MITTLGIVLAVLIAFNVWFGGYAVKRERERRKKLQDRMDEYDEFVGKHLNDMGVMREHLDEATRQLANAKSTLVSLHDEYETLKKEYDKLVAIHGDPHAEHQDPVAGDEPSVHTEHGDPFLRDMPSFAVDFDELRKSYDELAKSYNTVNQRYENPSKSYLVRNIVKAYEVKNRTALAKALGVSQQSVNKMLKEKK